MAPRDPKTPHPYGVPIHSEGDGEGANGDRSGKIMVTDLQAPGEPPAGELTARHTASLPPAPTPPSAGEGSPFWQRLKFRAELAVAVVGCLGILGTGLYYWAPRAKVDAVAAHQLDEDKSIADEHTSEELQNVTIKYVSDQSERTATEFDDYLIQQGHGALVLPPVPKPAMPAPRDAGE